jgi:hypothetical protein
MYTKSFYANKGHECFSSKVYYYFGYLMCVGLEVTTIKSRAL